MSPGGKPGASSSLPFLDHNREIQARGKAGCFRDMQSGVFVCTPERAGFGGLPRETKFGSRARETLREAGAVMDQRYGSNVLLLTWTLPGHGSWLPEALARYSGWLMQNILQWLRDTCGRIGYAWVQEMQKRGVLHGHIVVGCAVRERLEVVAEAFRGKMESLFESLSQRTGIDFFRNHETGADNREHCGKGQDAQFASKSVARYLAKYLSKHTSKTAAKGALCPSSWWRVSKSVNALVKSQRSGLRISGSPEVIDAAVQEVVALLKQQGDELIWKQNARFPFLWTVRAWSSSQPEGAFRFLVAKDKLKHAVAAGCGLSECNLVDPTVAVEAPAVVARECPASSFFLRFGLMPVHGVAPAGR